MRESCCAGWQLFYRQQRFPRELSGREVRGCTSSTRRMCNNWEGVTTTGFCEGMRADYLKAEPTSAAGALVQDQKGFTRGRHLCFDFARRPVAGFCILIVCSYVDGEAKSWNGSFPASLLLFYFVRSGTPCCPHAALPTEFLCAFSGVRCTFVRFLRLFYCRCPSDETGAPVLFFLRF